MILRDYQTKIRQDIHGAWTAEHRNICAVLPTGAGKTVIFSDILRSTNGPRFAIAHRQELVSQMSLALARCEVMHRVESTPAITRYIAHLHTVKTGRPWIDPRSSCVVIGVRTLLNRAQKLQALIDRAELWVIDECFPAGTMVDGKPIERYQVGDIVTSYNEKTGCLEKQRVTHVFKKVKPKYMVKLDTQLHHVIRCTPNHPFMTKRGWINAENIRHDDYVLLYGMRKIDRKSERGSNVSIQKDRPNILSKILRLGTSKKAREEKKSFRKNRKLCRMREGFQNIRMEIVKLDEGRTGVLLERLFHKISCSNFFGHNGPNESQIRKCKNEEKQSDAQRGNQKKGFENPQGARTRPEKTRRKWTTSDGIRKKIIRTISGFWFFASVHCSNRSLSGWFRISNALQNRLWKFKTKSRDRGGRVEPSYAGKTSAGQKERPVLVWERVANISIYESGDNRKPKQNTDDSYVYNLEVERTSTYIADGFVVHNCHHTVRGNQWGKAVSLFPSTCRGLGVTATPMRADGKGLGRHADGVADALIVGPNMRELINRGYLTDYRIFAPPSGFDLSRVTVGSSGDYTAPSLKAESKRSRIMGDVVEHYLRIAPGKLGVTFVTDVETATETAATFRAAGVPAEVLHANTPDRIRQEINDRLERQDIKQIVNVDILGEGYDCPAIEVCSMARPTESYGLFVQQFGRALRTMDSKTHAIIIDHVGNVMRHGLPDNPPQWTLDRREKRRSTGPTDAIPLRVCLACSGVYERILRVCPYCGTIYEPAGRQSPEQVDGDLLELDPAVLAALRGEVDRVNAPAGVIGDRLAHAGAPEAAIRGAMAQHTRRQQAQVVLRDTIALWAGYQRAAGVPDWQSYRKFYARYGIDVLGAQALGRSDAERLNQQVLADLPL